jgi:hypothetical protein
LLSPLLSVCNLDAQARHREAFKICKQPGRNLNFTESFYPDGARRVAFKGRRASGLQVEDR